MIVWFYIAGHFDQNKWNVHQITFLVILVFFSKNSLKTDFFGFIGLWCNILFDNCNNPIFA
jgi:hypothetical protein